MSVSLCLSVCLSDSAIARTASTFGTITLVVSNAAINRRKVTVLASMEIWKSVMDTNLIAAMNLARVSLPYLIRHAVLSGSSAGCPAATSPALVFVNTSYANVKQQVLPGIAPVRCPPLLLPVCGSVRGSLCVSMRVHAHA